MIAMCTCRFKVRAKISSISECASANLRSRRLHPSVNHSRKYITRRALGEPLNVLSESYTCSLAHRLLDQSSGPEESEARSHADQQSRESSFDGFRCPSILWKLDGS